MNIESMCHLCVQISMSLKLCAWDFDVYWEMWEGNFCGGGMWGGINLEALWTCEKTGSIVLVFISQQIYANKHTYTHTHT